MKNNFVLKALCCILVAPAIFASEFFPLTQLPSKLLSHVIASAFVQYDDPIEYDPVEFARLKLVSKEWHAIIERPSFKKLLEEKGFAEPVMMFHKLGQVSKILGYRELEKGIIALPIVPVTFAYIFPFCLHTDPQLPRGIFIKKRVRREDKEYVAIWVNPIKTYTQSNLKLSEDIARYEQAESKIITLYEMIGPKSENPVITFTAPISAKRFVKKWPKTVSFKSPYPKFTWHSSINFRPTCELINIRGFMDLHVSSDGRTFWTPTLSSNGRANSDKE